MVAVQNDIVENVSETAKGRENSIGKRKYDHEQQILIKQQQLISSQLQNGESTSDRGSDSNEAISDTSMNQADGKESKRGWKRFRAKHRPWSRTSVWKKRRKMKSLDDSDRSQPENENGWLTEGSPYVGKRIRRSILGDEGDEVGYGKANVIGWMPADMSDFICKKTGKPAPLWHIVYDEVCENDIRCGNPSICEQHF
jgi:hypothetical protein